MAPEVVATLRASIDFRRRNVMPHWPHANGAIKEKIASATGDHLVIIGPYGNVWHDGTFPTARAAEDYLRRFWDETDSFDINQWRLACASVTIEAFEPSFKFNAIAMEAATAGETAQTGSIEGKSAGRKASPNPIREN